MDDDGHAKRKHVAAGDTPHKPRNKKPTSASPCTPTTSRKTLWFSCKPKNTHQSPSQKVELSKIILHIIHRLSFKTWLQISQLLNTQKQNRNLVLTTK